LIAGLDFDGVAIGGLVLGEPPPVMEAMARACLDQLPDTLPRYVMGLGTDAELLTLIAAGADMFDCVLPTRLARNGTALVAGGRSESAQLHFAAVIRLNRWVIGTVIAVIIGAVFIDAYSYIYRYAIAHVGNGGTLPNHAAANQPADRNPHIGSFDLFIHKG